VDEREVLRVWRDLFHSTKTTPDTFAKAEALLDGLSGESPLHLRLGSELEELKRGSAVPKKKQASRRQTT
jgi:hypothetical protein